MTVSILNLPSELLAKIFSDESLSQGDIFRAMQVCRLFSENIQQCAGRRYTFIVDGERHTAWKFARCLLKNPGLGEQFVDITVEWDRRDIDDFDCWPQDWSWTEEEEAQIIGICENWAINNRTMEIILEGTNSESLLPFILCFTPKLKSLDLGCPATKIVFTFDVSEYDYSGHRLAVEHLGHEPDWDFRTDGLYDPEAVDGYDRVAEQYESTRSLFFFEYLPDRLEGLAKNPKLLPGLRSLQHFSMGRPIDGHIHDWAIFPVFICPRIESIHAPFPIEPCSHTIDPVHSNTSSTLKRLELTPSLDIRYSSSNFAYYENYLQWIASNLCRLEWVYVKGYCNPAEKGPELRKVEEEAGRAFLKNSKNTLKFTNILINGAGFDKDGTFHFDGERRRDVLRRQRAFELVSKGLRNLTVKPPPIVALGKPILSRIVKYLNKRDCFYLLLSSKAFYDACYHQLWSTFDFLFDTSDYGRLDGSSDLVSDRFLNILQEYGALGLGYLERLYINPDNHDSHNIKIYSALASHIAVENTPALKHLIFRHYNDNYYSVYGQCFSGYNDATADLLRAIKRVSEQKPQEDFSLDLYLVLSKMQISDLDLFDMTKLKRLDLVLHSLSLGQQLPYCRALIGVFAASSSLETLSIDWTPLICDSELLELLESINLAIGNLKMLRSMSIINTYFFHPSFLLIPPKGCKYVRYSHGKSALWWRKFAQEPFTGVETMVISGDYTDTRLIQIPNQTDEEISDSAESLELGEIRISDLTWIGISEPQLTPGGSVVFLGYPADFLDLILQNNKQLSRECLNSIAGSMAKISTSSLIVQKLKLDLANTITSSVTNSLDNLTLEKAKRLVESRSIRASSRLKMGDDTSTLLLEALKQELGPKITELCANAFQTLLRDRSED
ncbi:hypothetical protein TWF281_011728 [Arthrobotrys megalospora]